MQNGWSSSISMLHLSTRIYFSRPLLTFATINNRITQWVTEVIMDRLAWAHNFCSIFDLWQIEKNGPGISLQPVIAETDIFFFGFTFTTFWCFPNSFFFEWFFGFSFGFFFSACWTSIKWLNICWNKPGVLSISILSQKLYTLNLPRAICWQFCLQLFLLGTIETDLQSLLSA